jgi:hypothetical protein
MSTGKAQEAPTSHFEAFLRQKGIVIGGVKSLRDGQHVRVKSKLPEEGKVVVDMLRFGTVTRSDVHVHLDDF